MGPKTKSKRLREETSLQPQASKKIKPSTTQATQESVTWASSTIPVISDASNRTATGEVHPAVGLGSTYEITSINIMSSTSIQKQTTRVLEILSVYPAKPPAKPKVVLLHSKAKVASKMITIAEIAKRETAAAGGKWFQYSKVEELVVEQNPTGNTAENRSREKERDAEADDEASPDFEIMKTPFERSLEGKAKIRAVPHMTIYLSRVRIDSLRKELGEQTNALPATN